MQMSLHYCFLLLASIACWATSCEAQKNSGIRSAAPETYTWAEASRDGTGKFYHGREIARVMGHLGARWLERIERDQEENTTQAIANLDLKTHYHVADLGAGTGYYTFRIAPLVPEGKVYAVDIQPEMIGLMRHKKNTQGHDNVELIQSEATDPKLPENSLDIIIIVDVYHELSHPQETMEHLVRALKEEGRLILLEYRMEDPSVPIKLLHKMSVAQAKTEMKAVGLRLEKNIGNLPWQHFMVFRKE